MCQVDFTGLLLDLGLSSPIRAAILGVIIGWMAAPSSELAVHRWLGKHRGLGGNFHWNTHCDLAGYRPTWFSGLINHNGSVTNFVLLSDNFRVSELKNPIISFKSAHLIL